MLQDREVRFITNVWFHVTSIKKTKKKTELSVVMCTWPFHLLIYKHNCTIDLGQRPLFTPWQHDVGPQKKWLLPSACGDRGDKSATSGVSAQKIPASVSGAQRACWENDRGTRPHMRKDILHRHVTVSLLWHSPGKMSPQPAQPFNKPIKKRCSIKSEKVQEGWWLRSMDGSNKHRAFTQETVVLCRVWNENSALTLTSPSSFDA